MQQEEKQEISQDDYEESHLKFTNPIFAAIQQQKNDAKHHQHQAEKEQELLEFTKGRTFEYILIPQLSRYRSNTLKAFEFNNDASILLIGCEQLILVYELNRKGFKEISGLAWHSDTVQCLRFLNKSNEFLSGGRDKQIILWKQNEDQEWVPKQFLLEHHDSVDCITVSKEEEFFVSGCSKKEIRLWKKNDQGWFCFQKFLYPSEVYSISINPLSNCIICCGNDHFILIIDQDDKKIWKIKQQLQTHQDGQRLCFISDTQFAFQPTESEFLEIYDLDHHHKHQYKKLYDVQVKGTRDYASLFPQQFIETKQIVMSKHANYINFLKIQKNGQLKVEQVLDFDTTYLFGALSQNGKILVTWDELSSEIQIRKYSDIEQL